MEKEKENKTLLQSDIATSQGDNLEEEEERPSSSRLDKETSNDEKECGDDGNLDEFMKSVTPGLSKSQQKKLRKLQKWEEYKSVKRFVAILLTICDGIKGIGIQFSFYLKFNSLHFSSK